MADVRVAADRGGPDEEDGQPAGGLTELEEQILEALAHGKVRQEICQELGISRTMYGYHLHALRRYFRVRTTVEAVAVYTRQRRPQEFLPAPDL